MSIESIRFRTEGNLVVLQVLDLGKRSLYDIEKAEWRDAKVEDLLDVANFTTLTTKGNLDRLADRVAALEVGPSDFRMLSGGIGHE